MPKGPTEILKEDHQKARRLIEAILGGEGNTEAQLEELANDFRAHVALEQELFFPRVLQALGSRIPQDIVDDQRKEETEVLAMVDTLEEMGVDHEAFEQRLTAFRDEVLHHAEEVEEGRLFPLVEQTMARRDLDQLGREMERRHQELHRAMEARVG